VLDQNKHAEKSDVFLRFKVMLDEAISVSAVTSIPNWNF
jgi:hypothetical protein